MTTGSGDPPWHREVVGGLWEEVGRLQFDFMLERGLAPEHYLLDIGCGSLRGGIHFVEYLRPRHYYGVDADPALLEGGRWELAQRELLGKDPVLVADAEFHFASLEQTFDLALAQSLFTHLPINSIVRCLVSLPPVLRAGGALYATFFEHPAGKLDLEPVRREATDITIVTHPDRDPYHYDLDTFRWMCEGLPLEVEYIGEWGHPRGQRMLAFRRLHD